MATATADLIQDLRIEDIEQVNGGLSVNQFLGYTLIGATAIAVGAISGPVGIGLVVGGTALLALESRV